MTVSLTAWLVLIAAIGVMLTIDLLVVGRRGGAMSLRFASLASIVWIAIGIKMAAGEFVGKIGPQYSLPAIALILGTGVVASLVRRRRLVAA